MGTIPFSTYIASRPSATLPVADADRLLVLQGGAIKLVASGDTGEGGIDTILINAVVTPITVLPSTGEIVYVKSDDSVTVAGFEVALGGQTMCQELINGLSTQGETIRVKLIGTQWYKIA